MTFQTVWTYEWNGIDFPVLIIFIFSVIGVIYSRFRLKKEEKCNYYSATLHKRFDLLVCILLSIFLLILLVISLARYQTQVSKLATYSAHSTIGTISQSKYVEFPNRKVMNSVDINLLHFIITDRAYDIYYNKIVSDGGILTDKLFCKLTYVETEENSIEREEYGDGKIIKIEVPVTSAIKNGP